jgi:hypothetical protein
MADSYAAFWRFLGKAVSKIPFDKLTPNHAFDVACDLVMLGPIALALRSDLSGDRKLLVIFFCILLMAWSLRLNSPPRRRTTSPSVRRGRQSR